MRKYSTTSTMLTPPYGMQAVIEPDKRLVETLHRLLDMIPDDNFALSIDMCVSQLVQFHNPNRQHYQEIISPEPPISADTEGDV